MGNKLFILCAAGEAAYDEWNGTADRTQNEEGDASQTSLEETGTDCRRLCVVRACSIIVPDLSGRNGWLLYQQYHACGQLPADLSILYGTA